MSIQGLRDTNDVIALYHDRPANWRLGILMREPNGMTPLYALTAAAKSQSTDDPHYHWFEEEMPDYRVALDADIDASQTTFTLVSGALQFKLNDILKVEQTTELVRVNADPTVDTTLVVVRGHGGSTAAIVDHDAAGINPNLFYIGSSYAEGSVAPPGRSFNPSELFNYTQIFRDTLEITNTAKQTNYRTGDALRNDQRRALQRHKRGIEYTLFFGLRELDATGSTPRRTTGGIIQQIPSELQFSPASANTVTMAEFEGWMKDVFLWGSNEKMCFCGNNFMLGLQQMARKNSHFEFEMVDKPDFFGMNVRRFITPFGDLIVKTHPLFNQLASGSTAATAWYSIDSWGVILDMDNIKYRYMRGRDTKFEDKLQVPGTDGIKAGYITECGLQTVHARAHALITGVAAGTVDS